MAATSDQPVSVGNLAAVVEALRDELGGSYCMTTARGQEA